MFMRRICLFLAVASMLLGQQGTIVSAAEKLDPKLIELFNSPEYREAHWGCLVIDLETGETIYELNPDRLFAPASTTKLFSCAAALDGLGQDHRFETSVYRRGDIDESGKLRGDLIVVASGDFTLGGRTTPEGKIAYVSHDHTYANDSIKGQLTLPDPLQGLNDLAKKISASGLTQVRGDVVIDDRLFDKSSSSGSGPTNVTPILVNDNLIDFIINPAQAGQPATWNFRPPTNSIRVESQVKTVAATDPLDVSISFISPRNVLMSGQIPEGHKTLVRTLEVGDAASFARSLFIEALQRAGIIVERSAWAGNAEDKLPSSEDVARLPQVASFQSPPLPEALKLILKSSHNLHASTLPLILAVKHGKRSLADGMKLEHAFFVRAGINADTISFGGGAGGEQADAVTPRATVQLLKFMAGRPDATVYREALPILGVDGTLAETVAADSPAKGQVFAKTGTLYYKNLLNDHYLVTSKALAGYMTSSKKKKLAFAVFVNRAHIPLAADTAKVGKTLGRFCELVWESN